MCTVGTRTVCGELLVGLLAAQWGGRLRSVCVYFSARTCVHMHSQYDHTPPSESQPPPPHTHTLNPPQPLTCPACACLVASGVALLPGLGGFVSGSHDCSLRVWTLQGDCLAEMHGHSAIIYAVAATATGLIASGAARWQGGQHIWTGIGDGCCGTRTGNKQRRGYPGLVTAPCRGICHTPSAKCTCNDAAHCIATRRE